MFIFNRPTTIVIRYFFFIVIFIIIQDGGKSVCNLDVYIQANQCSEN